ncbi:hypothetical protein KDE13_09200 [Campylobacter sp. faydin G-140]|uniref:hypothetical protein n=1 Tax=Campylobacter anatolicus TaxID=2829105 RepID=UPI001B8DE6E1|nr:hypothetical protein [Campylobacter anatolicus]MBR8466509.1 hypothetical protein [Campylobacter anatolicus]
MKKLSILALLLVANFAFGAGEFDNVNNVVSNLDQTASATAGLGLKTIMAWLPIGLFLTGVILGYTYSKKKADQEQDSNKVIYTCIIAAVLGAIVGVLIDALIGAFLMQDSAKGLQVLKDYWTNALGV